MSEVSLEEIKKHTEKAYFQGNEDILKALIREFSKDPSVSYSTKYILNGLEEMLETILKLKEE